MHTHCIQLHDGTDSSEERVRIYHSLGYGTTDVLTYSCLDFSLSVSTVGPTFTIIIMIQTRLAGQTLMGEEGNRDVRVWPTVVCMVKVVSLCIQISWFILLLAISDSPVLQYCPHRCFYCKSFAL